MDKITRVGVDLAKRVIQVHAVDAGERVVTARAISRERFEAWCAQLPAGCIVAMEACSSAHHWGRRLQALGLSPRVIAAQFVSPYRMEGKGGKNDAADAAAICEAVQRPSMRFVAVKTAEQQSALLMHRVRELLVRQRTMLANALRGHMAEFGVVAAQGLHNVARLIAIVRDDKDERNDVDDDALARLEHRAA